MNLQVLHGEQAGPYSEEVESTWGIHSVPRAERGPAVRTSIIAEVLA